MPIWQIAIKQPPARVNRNSPVKANTMQEQGVVMDQGQESLANAFLAHKQKAIKKFELRKKSKKKKKSKTKEELIEIWKNMVKWKHETIFINMDSSATVRSSSKGPNKLLEWLA